MLDFLNILKRSKRGGDLKCSVCGTVKYYTIKQVQSMDKCVCKECQNKQKDKLDKDIQEKISNHRQRKNLTITRKILSDSPYLNKKYYKYYENKDKCKNSKSKSNKKKCRYEGEEAIVFDVTREHLIKYSGNKCSECNNQEFLHVHHIDENYKNNDISNLVVLCKYCHAQKHPRYSNFILGSK